MATDRPESFGYSPKCLHPDDTVKDTFHNSLVIVWDLKGSTEKVMNPGDEVSPHWAAQTDVLRSLQGYLRECPADITLPTGDGFIWIFDLEKYVTGSTIELVKKSREEDIMLPFLDVESEARPILASLIRYQDERAEARPLTDQNGVTQYGRRPCGFDVTVEGSTMLDGRFGVAGGSVEVHDCGSRLGPWIAPVGRPLFLASRLCSMAPDGGILIHEDVVSKTFPPEAGLPKRLSVTKERVEPKGWPEPVVVWRLAPKA